MLSSQQNIIPTRFLVCGAKGYQLCGKKGMGNSLEDYLNLPY